jgi:hypothetical protein
MEPQVSLMYSQESASGQYLAYTNRVHIHSTCRYVFNADYYFPMYAQVSQVVSSPQIFRLTLYVHLSLPCVLCPSNPILITFQE